MACQRAEKVLGEDREEVPGEDSEAEKSPAINYIHILYRSVIIGLKRESKLTRITSIANNVHEINVDKGNAALTRRICYD